MLGSNASRGGFAANAKAIHEERMTVTDLYGVAAVPSDLRIDDIPTNLVEAALQPMKRFWRDQRQLRTTTGNNHSHRRVDKMEQSTSAVIRAMMKISDDLEFVIAVCDAIGRVYTNLEARETLSTRLATAAVKTNCSRATR